MVHCIAALSLWLISIPAMAFTPTTGQESGIALVPHMSVLRDDSRALTIEDVTSPELAGKFAPIDRHLNAGFTTAAWWLHIPLDFKDGNATWWLEMFPPTLDDIQLYAPRPGGGFERVQVGDMHPASERPIRARNFVISLHNISGDYYLRVQTTSSFQPRITLWQPEYYAAAKAHIDTILGFYFGIALFTILLNLIYWLWLREQLHLYYSAYLLTYISAQFLVFGYAQFYLSGMDVLLDLLQKTLNCLLFMSTALFFPTLLNLKSHLPWLHRGMRVLASIMAGTALATLFGWINYPGALMGALSSLSIVGILLAGFWLLWRGTRGILYYFIAFFASAVVTLLYALSAIKLFDWTSSMDFIPMSASLTHIVLLNAGLIRRSRQAEQAKIAAERQALALARESELKLERRVEERTRELSQANSQLQQEIASREALQQHLLSTLSAKQQALKTQGEFFAMASHEFRTPLAIIDATTQRVMLQREDMRPPLEKIRRAAHRILAMIDTFLTADKLEVAGTISRQQTCDLRDIVWAGISPDRYEGAYRIHAELGDAPVQINCDRNLIELVLANLLGNALKYSTTDTDITVRVSHDATHACLEVEDHGIGIPAADLERIFLKYARLESAAGVEGSGFGLYIARLIAQRHGGDLTVDSEPGKGSCFRLTLPLHSEE